MVQERRAAFPLRASFLYFISAVRVKMGKRFRFTLIHIPGSYKVNRAGKFVIAWLHEPGFHGLV